MKLRKRKSVAWQVWCFALLAVVVAGCKGDGVQGTSGPGTLTSGAVSSTSPANGTTGVGTNTTITVNFSAAMTQGSINNASFTLTAGGIRVIGSVNYDPVNYIASFAPSTPLAVNTVYTATVTTAVEDKSGNALAADYVWTFTTGAGVDTVAPLVTTTTPAGGASGIAINAKIVATFSKVMNATSINATSFQVSAPGPLPIAGTVTYSGATAVFTPSGSLPAKTSLTATIAASATDLEGNVLSADSPFAWTFTTGAATDSAVPTVSSTSVAAGATGVPTNLKLSVFFSETMDPATITAGTFTLLQGKTPVTGAVTYFGGTTIFRPVAPLAANAAYTATITTGAHDLAGNALASPYVWSFTTGSSTQDLAPTVSQTYPPSAAAQVPVNTQIAVTFNEPMDPSTVTAANFSLQATGNARVAGTVTYAGATAIFTPIGNLLPGTQYSATVSNGVSSLAGTASAASYTWSFSTGAIVNTSAPVAIASIPARQLNGVALNSKIAVSFNQELNPQTLTSANFSLSGPGNAAVSGLVEVTGNSATFAPTGNLLPNTTYTAAIGAGTSDLSGNALPATYAFSFTTGATAGTTPPAVNSTVPVSGATGVFLNPTIAVTFSEAMDPATISASTFSVTGPQLVSIPGTVTYDPASNIAAFVPLTDLASVTTYNVTVGTGARDLLGNAMPAGKTWTFTTGPVLGGLAPVNLGSLASFAVVAGAGLNNSNDGGQTTINGNVGLSPTATCFGDGSTCSAKDPVVNGSLYANDTGDVAVSTKVDLAAAYSDAAGRVSGATANDLSAKVLAPGVYSSTAGMSIAPGGTVTLDAKGDPSAVWIFQVGSTLTANDNSQVTLVNGASAGNVFWAVAGASTMGANVSFQGNLLCGTSTSVGAGSAIVGRVLCATGAVNLVNTNITLPGR